LIADNKPCIGGMLIPHINVYISFEQKVALNSASSAFYLSQQVGLNEA